MCVISFIGRGKWGVAAHRRLSGKRSFYFHYIIWHNLSGLQRDAASGLSKVVESVPHPTPNERKSVARRAAARRATLFLSFFCRRRRLVNIAFSKA